MVLQTRMKPNLSRFSLESRLKNNLKISTRKIETKGNLIFNYTFIFINFYLNFERINLVIDHFGHKF